jgi:hypothetical protein
MRRKFCKPACKKNYPIIKRGTNLSLEREAVVVENEGKAL